MLIKLKIYGTKFIFSCGGIILQKTPLIRRGLLPLKTLFTSLSISVSSLMGLEHPTINNSVISNNLFIIPKSTHYPTNKKTHECGA
jgi:hypothetical protein